METYNIDLLEIIAKPWAKNEDIEKILNVSKSKANQIRQKIEQEIYDEGKKLPDIGSYVPMSRLVKYLSLDENRIIKLAKAEAEINQRIKENNNV